MFWNSRSVRLLMSVDNTKKFVNNPKDDERDWKMKIINIVAPLSRLLKWSTTSKFCIKLEKFSLTGISIALDCGVFPSVWRKGFYTSFLPPSQGFIVHVGRFACVEGFNILQLVNFLNKVNVSHVLVNRGLSHVKVAFKKKEVKRNLTLNNFEWLPLEM